MTFVIRDRSVLPGRRGLLRERAEYFRLMELGYSARGAARSVGVSPTTSKKWRRAKEAQVRALGPLHGPGPEPGPRDSRLGLRDRERIADMLVQGCSMRAIALELDRAPSTITREVAKYSCEKTGAYGPYEADRRARQARSRPQHYKLIANPRLRAEVEKGLGEQWSPEQISNDLRVRFPDDPDMQVSHETIYQGLYVQARGGLKRELITALRTGRTVRKPQRSGEQRRPRFTDPMVMISERPDIADRAVPGHWEGDLIIGKNNASQIGTLVERASRFVMLVHLPADRTAETVALALSDTIVQLPEQLRKSLTWDQGVEMAAHGLVKSLTGMPVYFCDPHSPWQRGSNENTNGLLRQYFPKGTDLSVHSAEYLAEIAAKLNRRPRETLGWANPAAVLNPMLKEAA